MLERLQHQIDYLTKCQELKEEKVEQLAQALGDEVRQN